MSEFKARSLDVVRSCRSTWASWCLRGLHVHLQQRRIYGLFHVDLDFPSVMPCCCDLALIHNEKIIQTIIDDYSFQKTSNYQNSLFFSGCTLVDVHICHQLPGYWQTEWFWGWRPACIESIKTSACATAWGDPEAATIVQHLFQNGAADITGEDGGKALLWPCPACPEIYLSDRHHRNKCLYKSGFVEAEQPSVPWMLALYVLISPCALSPRGRCPRSAPAVRLSGDKLNHTAYEGRNTQVDAGGRKLSNQKKVAHIYSRKQRGKWNPAGQEFLCFKNCLYWTLITIYVTACSLS